MWQQWCSGSGSGSSKGISSGSGAVAAGHSTAEALRPRVAGVRLKCTSFRQSVSCFLLPQARLTDGRRLSVSAANTRWNAGNARLLRQLTPANFCHCPPRILRLLAMRCPALSPAWPCITSSRTCRRCSSSTAMRPYLTGGCFRVTRAEAVCQGLSTWAEGEGVCDASIPYWWVLLIDQG